MSQQKYLAERAPVVEGTKDKMREHDSSRATMMMAGINPSSLAGPRSESGKRSTGRWVSGAGDPAKKVNVVVNEKRKIREAEKAETIMLLICWGPH